MFLRCLANALIVAGLLLTAPAYGQVLGGRVVGGHNAEPGAYPYQAYVLIKGMGACGGTLISRDWVLTAAHCARHPDTQALIAAEAYEVRIGTVFRRAGGEVHRVRQVIVHEGFNRPNPLENDIALLQLSQPSSLPPVALEGMGARTGERLVVDSKAKPWATVVGWGVTDPMTGATSDTLQEGSLPIVDNPTCSAAMAKYLPAMGGLDQRRLCAGLGSGGVDSCNGDSGGPLLAADGKGGLLQVGLVSFGVKKCAQPNAYGVYTRIAAFTDWISRNAGLSSSPPGSTAGPPPLAIGASATAPSILAAAEKDDGQVRVEILPRIPRGSEGMRLGDVFLVRVTSALNGSLALFDVGADGALTQLFPTPRTVFANKEGRLRAGAPLTIGDASYGQTLEAAEPKGRGRLLAVVTEDSQVLAGVVRAGDGLKSLTGGVGHLARLEVALKPTAAAPPSPSAPPPPSGARWAAGLADYIVH